MFNKHILACPLRLLRFFATAEFIRNDYHTIKYKEQNLDIVCPCYRFADGNDIIVIPWYLIPGRPYPLQVYQFACSYYCANPEIGQRGAAEATRTKFKLKTFSHSTICRSFRTFEDTRRAVLEKKFGEEIKLQGTEGVTIVSAALKVIINVDEEVCSETDEQPHSKKHFPSVTDTAERRMVMTGFLPKFQKDAKTADIEAAGCQFVRDWHKKTRRLLL